MITLLVTQPDAYMYIEIVLSDKHPFCNYIIIYFAGLRKEIPHALSTRLKGNINVISNTTRLNTLWLSE